MTKCRVDDVIRGSGFEATTRVDQDRTCRRQLGINVIIESPGGFFFSFPSKALRFIDFLQTFCCYVIHPDRRTLIRHVLHSRVVRRMSNCSFLTGSLSEGLQRCAIKRSRSAFMISIAQFTNVMASSTVCMRFESGHY